MKCAVVKVGGVTAIVCGSPKKPKKCVKCGINPGTRLCDWKIGTGTCDKPLCGRHSFSPAKNKDLCPEHEQEYKIWKARMEARAKKESAK